MKPIAGVAALAIALISPVTWPAGGLDETARAEIDQLVEFIGSSGCEMTRNGKTHDSREAADHVRRKYNHIAGRISTTEQFIRYAATKSSISGKAYTVQCGNNAREPSRDWLLRELTALRQG